MQVMIVYFHIFHSLFSPIKMSNVFLFILYLCRNIDKYAAICYSISQITPTCLAVTIEVVFLLRRLRRRGGGEERGHPAPRQVALQAPWNPCCMVAGIL